jgi:carbon monoxide dehydrogenase subunit G
MQLTEDFTVSVPADRLWKLLTDVELIAPCVPGFTLTEASHPDYRGLMKVKVGAITVKYDATITFVERDDDARRVVLSVRGREPRGGGSVDATVTSSLVDQGEQTTATMVTDVQVTGRVAQFGRGIIADVSSRMTEQFVDRLNRQLLAGSPVGVGGPAAAAGPVPAGAPANGAKPDPAPAADEALDLGAAAAVPVLKRVAPIVGAAVLAALLVWLIRWRSR